MSDPYDERDDMYPKHINSKEQKASAGNWGHPTKDEKKNVKYGPYPHRPPKVKHRSKKRKPIYRYPYSYCPFCDADLEKTGKKKGIFIFLDEYADECKNCGAKKVDEPCPACKSKRDMWKNKDGIITHMGYWHCGFKGKRIKQGLLREVVWILVLVIGVSSNAFAVRRKNPMTKKWETTTADSTVRKNPFTKKWSYVQPGSTLEKNPFNGKYEWCPPDAETIAEDYEEY